MRLNPAAAASTHKAEGAAPCAGSARGVGSPRERMGQWDGTAVPMPPKIPSNWTSSSNKYQTLEMRLLFIFLRGN